jgi:hypothetical protein
VPIPSFRCKSSFLQPKSGYKRSFFWLPSPLERGWG